MTARLSSLRQLLLDGRAAAVVPRTQSRCCVYDACKDLGNPLVTIHTYCLWRGSTTSGLVFALRLFHFPITTIYKRITGSYFPHMALPRFPDDHFVLVFAEDFRFYKADAEVPSGSAPFPYQSRGLPRRVLLINKARAPLILSPVVNPTRQSCGRRPSDQEGSNGSTSSSTFLLFG